VCTNSLFSYIISSIRKEYVMSKGKLPVEFEKLLVQWRSDLKMTQKQLAEELRVSQKTVCMWESGKFKASRLKEFQVLEWAFEKGLVDKSPRWEEDK